jgi:hypothetical protein
LKNAYAKSGRPFALVLFAVGTFGLTTDRVEQWGITWRFDTEYECGRFANGDWWVVGPVIIESIEPATLTDAAGLHNGWQVNPRVDGPQGFDERIGDFSDTLIPALPYVAQPGQSVVKAVSLDPLSDQGCRPCLKSAAVLTVVGEIPPDSGAAVFRPPYVASEKPYYAVADLNTALLPSLPPVPSAPTLVHLYEIFKRVRLDHQPGRTSTYLRPEDCLPFYAADINLQIGDGALRLMLDDPIQDKMPLLIAYVQQGIDYYHFSRNGQFWPAGGGEQPGNIVPMVFASVMLENDTMQSAIRGFIEADNNFPYADVTVRYNKDSIALWGHHRHLDANRTHYEAVYWHKLEDAGAPGSKTIADPYGHIDGGYEPGGGYQHCCTSQPFKSSITALHCMPVLKEVWNPRAVIEYVDRWVTHGTWTQPDPCAPVLEAGTYGVDYGPDPDNPGDCIRDTDHSDGIGRFPSLHGAHADDGHRRSAFAAEMYDTYRHTEAATRPRAMSETASRPTGPVYVYDIRGRRIGTLRAATAMSGGGSQLAPVIAVGASGTHLIRRGRWFVGPAMK